MTEVYTPDTLFAGDIPAPVSGKATIAAGAGALVRGTVLGIIRKAIEQAVAAGTNAGNGTVTGEALGPGAQIGTYTLECIGGALTAAKGNCVGTGNGALTLDAAPILEGAQSGVYKAVCLAAAANAGVFGVFDPNGVYLGAHTVGGAAFATQIKFTIADGANDFVVGDYFEVTVSPSVPANGLATFSVTDPAGNVLPSATVGTAYADEIAFTINDGANNFELGDTFTVEVSEGSGEFDICDSTNVDGTEAPEAILAKSVDATLAAKVAPTYEQGIFNEGALVFGGNDAADTHRAALRNKGIFLRSVISGATE